MNRATSTSDLDAELLDLPRRLMPASRGPGAFAHDRAMGLLVRDSSLRAASLRLIDVAPACASPQELSDHLAAFLEPTGRGHTLAGSLRRASHVRVLRRLMGRSTSVGVRRVARRFIVGESAELALPVLRGLWAGGAALSVDLLGEATVTVAEGRAYAERCVDTLQLLSRAALDWPSRPLLEGDGAGPLARINLSIKVTALTPLARPAAPERGRADASEPLRRLLRTARDLGAHLHVDSESLDSQELVLGLVLGLLAEPEFADGPSAGVVLQAYLRDSEATAERLLRWAACQRRSVPLTIRLVKGAYWDHETILAAQHGWRPPVWTRQEDTDRCFERLARRLIDTFPLVRTAVASHNPHSLAYAVTCARRAGLRATDLEVQVLRGLGDELADRLRREGLRARVYCPVGDTVAGMAYLARRLLENTSNGSFLASRAAGGDVDRLPLGR